MWAIFWAQYTPRGAELRSVTRSTHKRRGEVCEDVHIVEEQDRPLRRGRAGVGVGERRSPVRSKPYRTALKPYYYKVVA